MPPWRRRSLWRPRRSNRVAAVATSSHVGRGHVEHTLQLERRQRRMLAEDPRADAAQVRGGEGVAAGSDRWAIRPGHLDVLSGREEFDWRVGVVAEVLRVSARMSGDGDDGGESPRP